MAAVFTVPPNRIRAAIVLLAAAFHDDPAMRALQPEPVRRRAVLEGWFAGLHAIARRHGGWPLLGIEDGGRLVAAALAFRLGRYPPPAWSVVRGAPGVMRGGPGTMIRAARWGAARARITPRADRFAYLELLGTEAGRRGGGFGGALVEHVVENAGGPVVLHTNSEANVRWYERHGFAVTGHQVLPFGVDEWLLERDGP
jgi:GNAT superfamily N-acetyltransferase